MLTRHVIAMSSSQLHRRHHHHLHIDHHRHHHRHLQIYQGVPFGSLGSIVGVHDGLVDVLFDVAIVSGTDLHSRCSQSRGLTLSPKSILNLSQPRVPSLNKHRKPKKKHNVPKPKYYPVSFVLSTPSPLSSSPYFVLYLM